jgi:hypothetical protein
MVERILSAVEHGGAVKESFAIDLDALLEEIARYLAAVEAFRAAACEPTWLPESVPAPSVGTSSPSLR